MAEDWVDRFSADAARLLRASHDNVVELMEDVVGWEYEPLASTISSCIFGASGSGDGALNMALKRCESPIEQAMLGGLVWAAFVGQDTPRVHVTIPGESGVEYRRITTADNFVEQSVCDADLRAKADDPLDREYLDHSLICPQFPVGKYRADFAVFLRGWSRRAPAFSAVLVECDGHDYHERSKEQARRDKSRDRALLASGYRVLRFTGSEIWRSPLACGVEVLDFLDREVRAQRRSITGWAPEGELSRVKAAFEEG